MNDRITLDSIMPGEVGYISTLLASGSIRRRLLDLGFVENTEIECVGKSPLGDPKAYLVRGAVIALRSEDSRKILINSKRRGVNGTY